MGQPQLAHEVVERRGGDLGVAGRPRRLEGLEVGAREQGVVVQHLLEVRDEPDRVDRVAVEAAGELVVDAAGRHVVERQLGHPQRLGAARLPVLRSRNQSAHEGGNFGAPPNPPLRSSSWPRSATSASRQQAVGESGPVALGCGRLASASVSCAACPWTSSSRSR